MSRKVFVFICLLLAVFLRAVFAEAQQPKKIFRIGYRRSIQLLSPPMPKEFGWRCAILAT
jgi:hypothetical protein